MKIRKILKKTKNKHPQSACIKTATNLLGLDFMPKLLVTRWKRKKPIYLSSLKNESSSEEQLANVDEVVVRVSENVVLLVSADMVFVKQKVGRPRKIEKA